MATETVNVKFLSDTKGYVTGLKDADKATDSLTSSLKQTSKAQKEFDDEVSLSKVSVDELGLSVKQTGEGAVDSITGMSGLGAAISNIGTSAVTAIKGLSGFKLALIGTGIGAVVVALGAMVAYWDDITDAIGLSTHALDEFNEQQEKAAELASKIAGLRTEWLTTIGENDVLTLFKKADLKQELTAAEKLYDDFISNVEIRVSAGYSRIEAARLAALDIGASFKEVVLELEIAKSALDEFNDSIKDSVSLSDVVKQMAESPEGIGLDDTLDETIDKYIDEWNKALSKIVQLSRNYSAEQEAYRRQDFIETGEVRLDNERRILSKIKALNEIADEQVLNSKIDTLNAGFDIAISLSEEQKVLQGGIMVAQAFANGWLAQTKIIADPTILGPAIPAAIIASWAAVAASVVNIATLMGSSSGGGATGSTSATTSRAAVETSLPSNIQDASFVPVLVTDDFNRVDNRVKVVQDRSSFY